VAFDTLIFVYKKNIDGINLGEIGIRNFMVEVGVMDYGFEINGILGMDFMRSVGIIMDLDKMVVYSERNN